MSEVRQEAAYKRIEDRIDAAWIWDRIAKALIFIGGISAIIFVISIFVFVAKEGLGFALFDLDKLYRFWAVESRKLAHTASRCYSCTPKISQEH